MGVDLRLLPLDYLSGSTDGTLDGLWGYSHTVLRLPRNREAWKVIETLPTVPVDKMKISSYVGGEVPDGTSQGETMYGTLTEDAYGQPYDMVKAGILAEVLEKHFPKHPVTAYVGALSAETLIVLDWH